MAEYVSIARLGDLKEQGGHCVQVKGRLIGLFLHEGQVHAVDDTCPHMGASLSEGYVENGIVTCPWHAWRFRVTDGVWADAPNSKSRLSAYQVRVEQDQVLIAVDW